MSQLSPVSFMGTALVPAVLVSACALLLLSFNNRIVAVLTRQRALHRELLEGARKARGATLSHAQLVHPGIVNVWAAEPSMSGSSRNSSNKDLAAKEDQIFAEERFATSEWATGIERQIADLRREAVLIRAAVSFLLAAILLFLVSGVVLAVSQLKPRAEKAAIAIFLAALCCFASAVLLMMIESLLIIHPVVTEEVHLRRIISQSQSHMSLQVLAR